MENLPDDWRVGLLYDIACQLHSSAAKHGFFNRYLHRLQFAVSVFHAFGHDWPCQLIYHPRKCIGFGLSDGEGCERFWYSISKLIPYLRVAGYHLRMYTLNTQFAFATKESIANLAAWLKRKMTNAAAKRKEADLMIEEAGEVAQDESFIREQWEAQVREQTKPSRKQNKGLGEKEVQLALELHGELQKAEEGLKSLRAAAQADDLDLEQEAELRSAEAKHLAAQARYDRKVAELGVKGRAKLSQLTKSKILTRRANGLVLLRKAQAGIMKRKMEVERTVGSHRNKHGEKKLRKHITTAAERREGTIKSIVSKYNKACRDLAAMIKREITRKGRCAIRPLTELPTSGIWDLGIDNACWDDLRFDGDATDRAPAWMSDHNTRQAIRGRLLLDRCDEEDARLAHERANVVDWLEGEWLTVAAARRAALRAPGEPHATL
ncbi:uncharacterized protein SCHCODRAFT_01111170 [Schizophyllum commune H4-8]|nr:uncharacterized protein SCHCODRAFT_01111170 [Schizophyllum commune H4-8]KAI5836654.1 hypothetical protein SCHCODRAFT_01111170 [Schizophyllum commune H4-8]